MTVTLKATCRPGLLAGRFRSGLLDLVEGRWSEVDASDEHVRADLVKYVGSHVRLAQGQDAELAVVGLAFKDGRLVEKAKAAQVAAQVAPPPVVKEKGARAEK